MFSSHGGHLANAMYHHGETLIKLTHHDETKIRAHDSQIVRAKENLKLSHGVSSYRQAPGTNPLIKALRQSCHRVRGLTHHRAIKEETTAINCDWAQNQARRLPHDTQATLNPYTTLHHPPEPTTKTRFSNNSLNFTYQITVEYRFRHALLQKNF